MDHLHTTMSTHLRYKFPELNVTTTILDEKNHQNLRAKIVDHDRL